MKTHLTVDDPFTADEKIEYDTEVNRLLCSGTIHTAMDLDEMWSLFYATGDIRFPNRIKNVIDDTNRELPSSRFGSVELLITRRSRSSVMKIYI